MGKRRLPCAWRAPTENAWNEQGDPLWVARDSLDWEALEAVCGVFEAELDRTVAALTKPPSEFEDRGMVVAVGKEAREAASVYAHLTQRRWRFVEDLSEQDALCGVELVVTTVDALTPDFFESVYQAGGKSAIGVLAATNAERLRRAALVRSAAAHLGSGERWKRSVIIRDDPRGESSNALATFDECTSRPPSLMVLTTHSDGFHAHYGKRPVLCSIKESCVGGDPARAPNCVLEGVCNQLDVRLEDVRRSGAMLSGCDLVAQVLLWATCNGVVPSTDLYDPSWGVGAQLLENSRIGAFVTTWEQSVWTDGASERLAEYLESGLCLGECVARVNRAFGSEGHGGRLCLFGDPRIRFAARDGKEEQSEDRPTTQSLRLGRGLASDLDAVRALRFGLREKSFFRPRDDVLRQCAALDRAVRSAARGGGNIEGPLSEVFKRLIDPPAWIERARLETTAPCPVRCPACDGVARRRFVGGEEKSPLRREIVDCPRCGRVRDAPEEFAARLRIDGDGTARLLDRGPQGIGGTAHLVVRRPPSKTPDTYVWPSSADGRFTEMGPRIEWPDGLVTASLRMVMSNRFAFLGAVHRVKSGDDEA